MLTYTGSLGRFGIEYEAKTVSAHMPETTTWIESTPSNCKTAMLTGTVWLTSGLLQPPREPRGSPVAAIYARLRLLRGLLVDVER